MQGAVLWPLLTIAAGLLMMQLGGRLGVRLSTKWRRVHPDGPPTEEVRLAFVRENPATWFLPVFSFGSLGLVLGGLLWLALVLFF